MKLHTSKHVFIVSSLIAPFFGRHLSSNQAPHFIAITRLIDNHQ